MSDAILKVLAGIRKVPKAQPKIESEVDLSAILAVVRQLYTLLTLLQVGKTVENLESVIGPRESEMIRGMPKAMARIRAKKNPEISKVIDGLAEQVPNRANPVTKRREFVLYRATTDGEYEKCAVATVSPQHVAENNPDDPREPTEAQVRPNQYQTTQNTEWWVDPVSAETARVAFNPVVGCWIDEDSIAGAPGLRAGQIDSFSGMGKNPAHKELKVVVVAGTYDIFSELKGQRQ
jgi:hypothetical protein